MNEEQPSLATIPIQQLRGVGPKLALRLEKLAIHTVQDLLFHLPLRYEDRTTVSPIACLKTGQTAVVQGSIKECRVHYGRTRQLLCHITDNHHVLTLRFFHFTAQQQQILGQLGHVIRCYGEVRWGSNGMELIHPEFHCVSRQEDLPPLDNCLTPVYPTTEGLHQITFRKLIEQALSYVHKGSLLQDYLPETVLNRYNLPSLREALSYVHKPPRDAALPKLMAGVHPAQQRLAFEELLAHQLSLAKLRARIAHLNAPMLKDDLSLTQKLLADLPFQLTNAQQRVINEIKQDMSRPHPMMRLVQGDVGSGKTVVAALAILMAVESGYQAAIMAPTELLVDQHTQNFSRWFDKLQVSTVCLTSNLRGKKRDDVVQQIQSGEAKVIIGTHALFQKDIHFANLALIVVDEQHRFGVHQRLALREKGIADGIYPHQLIMTATPIPRTLAMTAYADLNCSIIDEMPPGRLPVATVAVGSHRRDQLIERVRLNCLQGRQVYWVCTLIEESELLQCQAAEKTAQELHQLLPEMRIGLVHGRLKTLDKEQIMSAFKNHELDILVATTVIEVGVDVPNASLMIIENSERLGLSQLHQLRGRVGRGSVESHCVLLYKHPLSRLAKQRIQVMRDNSDGFVIAQKDLELRGPGEVLGTKQTGILQLKIADIMRDKHQLVNVQHTAALLMHEHPEVIDLLICRWLAQTERFGDV